MSGDTIRKGTVFEITQNPGGPKNISLNKGDIFSQDKDGYLPGHDKYTYGNGWRPYMKIIFEPGDIIKSGTIFEMIQQLNEPKGTALYKGNTYVQDVNDVKPLINTYRYGSLWPDYMKIIKIPVEKEELDSEWSDILSGLS